MSKTLYITDLDGTLLNDSGVVSPKTSEIITRLSHQGILISVATARTPATVVDLLRDTYTTADLVVMTGAGIWDRPGHCFRSLELIPQTEVFKILEVFNRRGVYAFCYTRGEGPKLEVYHGAPTLNSAEALFVEQRKGLTLKTFHLATECPATSTDRVALFFGMGPKENIVAVADELKGITNCYVSYYKDTYNADLWLLEIFAHGVSKSNGVRHLRDNIGADRVVAFGDNLNDLPMLRDADVAVAVANALPEVRAIADVVIGSNNDDSVARFIAYDSLHN